MYNFLPSYVLAVNCMHTRIHTHAHTQTRPMNFALDNCASYLSFFIHQFHIMSICLYIYSVLCSGHVCYDILQLPLPFMMVVYSYNCSAIKALPWMVCYSINHKRDAVEAHNCFD